MVDAYLWPPHAETEDGNHVIAHVIQRLKRAGMIVVPVVGYDRWENESYQTAIKGIGLNREPSYCLRLDSQAIDDAAESDLFQSIVKDIVSGLDLLPSQCSALIDFGDVSGSILDKLLESAVRIVRQLEALGFGRFVIAGCSIPRSIELAVKEHDSSAMVTRREILLWKALRREFRNLIIVYGDYGVRGPNTNDEMRTKYTNGKIRHTTSQQTLMARGHPCVYDHNMTQMHTLANKIVESPHFLGPNFSWGDERIYACSCKKFMGSMTDWIAIDTNHHLAFVVQEVEEFERSIVVANKIKTGA